MHVDWDLEQAAAAILEETNQGGFDVDIAAVARRLGLTVSDGGKGCEGYLFGREIIVDETLPRPKWNFDVGHEVGHFDNQRHGRPDTEWSANYLSSALLMPRDSAEVAIRRTGWDLFRLMSTFRSASGEAIARRLYALRGARVHIFDRPEGRELRSYAVPRRLRCLPVEQEAVDAAFAGGAPVEPYPGVHAWPLFQEGWQRVIVVSDPDSAACA
ncbi:MAG: hypothetical protein SangKO_075390 [Sandaracinaceae bacterium]